MNHYSPYLSFSRAAWQQLRKETPLTITEADLEMLRGQIEAISIEEVVEIYLPLSRLLNFYITGTQALYQATIKFLGHPAAKVPYVIGIAGSVAVGKSTTSRVLQILLSRWPSHPKVALVTTDGFLYPNEILQQRNLLNRKGFPESYDLSRLLEFLTDLKSGKSNLRVPIYSHDHYDILDDQYQLIQKPDIVIVEGVNVLQVGPVRLREQQKMRLYVSDFFDFTIYVDAETKIIKEWFLKRFMLFREKSKNNSNSFFYQFANVSDQEALQFANQVWNEINETNLNENILPFRERAKLILVKNKEHMIEKVYLRKI